MGTHVLLPFTPFGNLRVWSLPIATVLLFPLNYCKHVILNFYVSSLQKRLNQSSSWAAHLSVPGVYDFFPLPGDRDDLFSRPNKNISLKALPGL